MGCSKQIKVGSSRRIAEGGFCANVYQPSRVKTRSKSLALIILLNHDHFRPNMALGLRPPNEIFCSDPGFAVPCIVAEDGKCLLVATSLQQPQPMPFIKFGKLFFLGMATHSHKENHKLFEFPLLQ